MRDFSLHEGTCICGKVKFASVAKARQFDSRKRIYFCEQSSTYHITNKKKWESSKPPNAFAQFNLRRLQRELNDLATMQDYIRDYMREQYKKNKQYKFTSSEVIDGVLKKTSTYSRSTISAQISTLKTRGVIEDLGEQVPGGRQNSKYFTLPELLEEVTKPTAKLVTPVAKKEEEPVSTKSPVSTKLPSQATPSNPFDKVNSQLGELLQKVNGLLNGYTELAEGVRNQRETTLSGFNEINAKIDSSEVKLEEGDFKTIRNVVNSEASVLLTAFTAILTQQTGTLSKSLMILEENTRENIIRAVTSIETPEHYGSLSDDEKYRTGIKEGIRLAVEMGLKLD